eukprot:COSAG01_NODE_5137_length_4461_cov_2.612016_5_plen_425_part_00
MFPMATTEAAPVPPADGNEEAQLYRLSGRVGAIKPSATAAVTDLAIALRHEGRDVISLSVGEPDFAPPAPVIAATAAAAGAGHTTYTAVAGSIELRQEVARYLSTQKGLSYAPEQVLVSSGAKQSLMQAITALCGPGDQVLVPAPYWVSYVEQCTLADATAVVMPTRPEDGFLIQPEALDAAICPATRLLILCNPSNPTGAVYPKEHLERLAAVLRKHPHVLVVADEIYERITFDTPHVAFGALDGMLHRTITINGFSKAFAMTGYRVGYMAAPLPIVKACSKLQGQLTSCASSIGQYAACAALREVPETFFSDAVTGFRAKRDFVLTELAQIPGVTCAKPEGAFYVFPVISAYFGSTTPGGSVVSNSNEICVYILDEEQVALVPGLAFGDDNCLRICYATSMQILQTAMERVSRAFSKLQRGQ